ncbi:uncharacterized protein LOC124355866 [Homalodisca vitripennis]|uniref:uncharacterized protein LOC124355866 n=1 Tax=Homalodisca vitripennis TaxID=197043 RepID=UPI001EEA29EE|nr:uncharacterized protein LOC124355866 [Homalodisca vitripennis]
MDFQRAVPPAAGRRAILRVSGPVPRHVLRVEFDYVKKKIDLLRGNFRREHKKVIESKRSGAGTDAVHVPKLWYYKLLLFLSDQEEVRLSITSLDSPTEDSQQTGPGHADDDVLNLQLNIFSLLQRLDNALASEKNSGAVIKDLQCNILTLESRLEREKQQRQSDLNASFNKLDIIRFEELCSVIEDFQFDLLGITESWLSSETPSHVFDVPCYSLHRFDRPTGLGDGGGGIVLYVKQEIKFVRLYLQNVDNRIEYISGVVNLKGLKLLICIAYRPPDVPYSTLSSLIHALYIDESPGVDSVILLGDLNVNLLNQKRADVKYLERIFQSMGLSQIIKEPTRVTESSFSLIDLIIVDKTHYLDVGMVDTSNIFNHNGRRITDHRLTYCDVPCKKSKSKEKFITYRNFRDFDGDTFIDVASNIHWDNIMTHRNVDDIANVLTKKIVQVFDECAPLARKRITRKKAPWRDSNIAYLTKKKNNCKHTYLSLKTQVSRNAYRRARNALNVAIRSVKRKYFTDTLNTKNSKTFWATLRDGGLMRSVEEKDYSVELEDLNHYFSTMGCNGTVSTEKLKFFNSNKCAGIDSTFTFSPVSESKVKELMNSITSTAFGVDGISIKMVTGLSPFCIGAVSHLVNVSLKTGNFPSSWKQSVVVPLPKNLNPTLVSDFRPISILPVISKILE